MPLTSMSTNNFKPMDAMLKISLLTCILLGAFITPSCSVLGLNDLDDYGKRTLGTKLNDQAIESHGLSLIKSAHAELSQAHQAHINITAFNGTVLITGQVASEAAKRTATDTLTGLRHVRAVHNKLAVAGPTSVPSRGNDIYLTTKVKAALLFDKNISGRTKVITENGSVFLLGLVTQNEADLIVDKASKIFGVQEIVAVFEYID